MNTDLRDGRRDRLVDSAKNAFARKGYYATSISEIVQHAGIARGTFYHYFDNKLHIFESILDSFLQNLRSCIKPVSLSPGAPAPFIQIRGNLTRVLDLVLSEKDLTQILLHHESTSDRNVDMHLESFYRQAAAMTERSLALGLSMGLVRPCNARLTSYAIIGAVKEVVLRLTSDELPQPPVEELVDHLLEFGMRGILSESQAHLLGSGRASKRPDLPVNPSVRV